MRVLRQLESQLQQLQRLEALGSLVGGVSHEFKNLLLGISACAEGLQRSLGPAHELIGTTYDLVHCVDRGRKLVDKLLAFGKRQELDTRPVDINSTLLDIESLLRRMLGEHCVLEMQLAPEPLVANVDIGQIEQVIINLAINAQDAMQGSGNLTMRTGRHSAVPPQGIGEDVHSRLDYVEIVVEDTGHGMEEEVRERVFEPFFTTKTSGTHAGLGLSVAYGIIRQHGGLMEVTSRPGEGTQFFVRIPAVDVPPVAKQVEISTPEGGTEMILLVEDEDMVRAPLKSALESYGYRVQTAADGLEAIELFNASRERIDLIITDLAMPKAGGTHLYEAINGNVPQTKFLFITGYKPSAIHTDFVPPQEEPLLMKPFSMSRLAAKVREILDKE
jgi:nitrogen-specific signal transduction histidine kinase